MSNVIWKEIRQTFQRNDRMVYQLIAINVVVFIGLNLIQLPYFLSGTSFHIDSFSYDLGLPASLRALWHQPWTLFTFMFTHFELGHIFWNMLLLLWFGRILSEFAGNKKILPVYLLGGICGGIFFIAAYNIFPVFSGAVGDARAWGASASVMAIVFAAVTLVPDYQLFLLLFGSVKIKWIGLILLIIDVVGIPVNNAGGHIAHLGGALLGFIFINRLQKGRDLGAGINRVTDRVANFLRGSAEFDSYYRTKEKKTTTSYYNKQHPATTQQEKIDVILDKISQSGYDSLSKEEKDFLFRLGPGDHRS